MPAFTKSRQAALAALLLLISTLLVYWPVRHFEFIDYDDSDYVSQNKVVLRGLSWEGLRWAFVRGHAANWHPFTWLSHMLDVQLFGLNAGRHHLVNVLFHSANVVLLFLMLRKLTGAIWRSAFVAGLFALHPLHVESVAWIAERKDVLSTFFFLSTIWAYVKYVEKRQLQSRKFTVIWYFVGLGLFACGLMSKPMLVTLPFVLLLLDFWPLRRLRNDGWLVRSGMGGLLLEKAPFFALAIASSVITLLAQTRAGAATSFENLPLGTRLMSATMAYCGYIAKMFWPDPLAVFYPYRQDWTLTHVLLAVGCLLVMSVVSIFLAKRRPYLFVGWFWYLGMLVPVIGLVQVGAQAMADRYTYLPSVGIFIAGIWGAHELTAKWRYANVAWAAIGCVALVACAAVTARQLAYWKNTEELCRHALQVTQENFPAHAALGAYLLEHGRIEEAKHELAETIRLNPQHASAHYLLGGELARERKFQEAREHLDDAIRAHPTFVEAYLELADIANAQGQAERGFDYALKALAFAPHSPDAHFSAGASLLLQQKFSDALPHYEVALREKPDFTEAELDWGKALLQLGRPEEAETHLLRASELQPTNLEPHRFLAEVYARENRGREQVRQYEQMLRLAPEWPEVLNNLAWLLATHPDAQLRNGPRAVKLSQQACASTGQTNYLFLSTLAAAYAEAGSFGEAVATQQEVCKLAEASGGKSPTEMFRKRLELYLSEKPFHKPK